MLGKCTSIRATANSCKRIYICFHNELYMSTMKRITRSKRKLFDASNKVNKDEKSKKLPLNIVQVGKKLDTPNYVERDKRGYLVFPDFPSFRPNRSPKEILQAGSFGGTYFRSIKSSVTNEVYKEAWKEFPDDWFHGLDIEKQVTSQIYRKSVNKHDVKCGASLHEWESSGWIKAQDPYGWFQWYCRFFLGRRTNDDKRQISRWKNFDGRFKNNLINQIRKKNAAYNDYSISPAIRQSLLHWGIQVTQEDVVGTPTNKDVSIDMKKRLIDLVPLK